MHFKITSLGILLILLAAFPGKLSAQQKQAGEARVYYPNGAIKGEFPYLQGRLDGTVRWYYESGALGAVMQYKNNRLHGLTQTFYENGRLRRVFRMEDNKLVGFAKYFAESGELTEVFAHRDGIPMVRWTYDSSGQVLACEPWLSQAENNILPDHV